jgi:hypothetical protein
MLITGLRLLSGEGGDFTQPAVAAQAAMACATWVDEDALASVPSLMMTGCAVWNERPGGDRKSADKAADLTTR